VARFEMLREIGFLLFPIAGSAIGGMMLHDVVLPAPLLALGSSALGLLVAAGAIWLTRILGTLGFGREAMGLGDVHLMAAAGAVIGWRDGLLAYLVAPFLAILWVLCSGGVARMRGKAARELPYGPHLALACVIVFLGRPWVGPMARTLFGF
jgi:leader peptidase (prepilin peptidase)/N-methyltransferase